MSPISRGSLSCRLYRVTDEVALIDEEAFVRKLKRYWFQEIDARRGEERSVGWVSPRQILATECSWHEIFIRPYLALGLRVDKKSLNPAMLRARLEQRLEQFKREEKRPDVRRDERKSLEEETRMNLLAAQTPSTQILELSWNMDSGLIVFAATGEAQNRMFHDYFSETFEYELLPLNPFFLADQWTVERGLEGQLEDVWPAVFAPEAARQAVAAAAAAATAVEAQLEEE
ncbi:recombination-associated protein RdgC [Candidatus Sumerlaeota bacterium]